MRSLPTSWSKTLTQLGFTRQCRQTRRSRAGRQCSLRMEPLEQRRVLAIVVDTLADQPNGANTPGTSLREALAMAASMPGPDTIEFDDPLFQSGPATILIGDADGSGVIEQDEEPGGQNPAVEDFHMLITSDVTIMGPGADQLTIQAYDPTPGSDPTDTIFGDDADGSGIFLVSDDVDNNLIDVTIRGVTLTGADTLGVGPASGGGAITNAEILTIQDSTITGNHATGAGGGGAIYQGFDTDPPEQARLTIRNTLVENSRGSVAIFARGSVTIDTNSMLRGNIGGEDGGALRMQAIPNTLTSLRIIDSVVAENVGTGAVGGAISVDNEGATGAVNVLIERTEVRDNEGGGFRFYGGNPSQSEPAFDGISIVDSTFANNIAPTGSASSDSSLTSAGGSAVEVFLKEGGVTPLSIVNSTFSGNETRAQSVGGAAYGAAIGLAVNGGSLDPSFTNLTITGNKGDEGAGVRLFSAPVTMHNSIVAGNFDLSGQANDVFGTVESTSSHNLVGVDIGLMGITDGDVRNNMVGTAAVPIDPLLAPLQDFGGPTRTHALLFGSPALDAGTDDLDGDMVPDLTQNDNDQRGTGFGRVKDGDTTSGAAVDIGAFEHQRPPFVVTTINDALNPGTLRQAILDASNATGWDIIGFDIPRLNAGIAQTINLNLGMFGPPLGELEVDSSVGIRGPGKTIINQMEVDLLTITAANQSRVFNVQNVNDINGSGFVYIEGVAVTGGSGIQGGGIRAASPLWLEQVVLKGNTATAGAGVFVSGTDASLTVNESEILNNSASEGGGLYVQTGEVDIVATTIDDNTAWLAKGGGVYVLSGERFSVLDSTISNNHGVGVQTFAGYHGVQTYHNSTISNNEGDGIHFEFTNNGELFEIVNSTIVANDGDGVHTELSTIALPILHNTIVAGNGTDIAGSVDAAGSFNLIGDPAEAGGLLSSSPENNVLGDGMGNELVLSSIINTTLADNGGPTLTHALAANSPALDRGSDDRAREAHLCFDQTGNVRIVDLPGEPGPGPGDKVDIGAVEMPDTSGAGSGALIAANAAAGLHGGDTVDRSDHLLAADPQPVVNGLLAEIVDQAINEHTETTADVSSVALPVTDELLLVLAQHVATIDDEPADSSAGADGYSAGGDDASALGSDGVPAGVVESWIHTDRR